MRRCMEKQNGKMVTCRDSMRFDWIRRDAMRSNATTRERVHFVRQACLFLRTSRADRTLTAHAASNTAMAVNNRACVCVFCFILFTSAEAYAAIGRKHGETARRPQEQRTADDTNTNTYRQCRNTRTHHRLAKIKPSAVRWGGYLKRSRPATHKNQTLLKKQRRDKHPAGGGTGGR